MLKMLSLIVQTKQCSNEQQLTSNVPESGTHTASIATYNE